MFPTILRVYASLHNKGSLLLLFKALPKLRRPLLTVGVRRLFLPAPEEVPSVSPLPELVGSGVSPKLLPSSPAGEVGRSED